MSSRDSCELSTDVDELLNWLRLNGVVCTRSKLGRKFTDGVAVATLLKKFYPKLVDLHNYPAQSSFRLKLINWETLNAKVLSKVNMPQSKKSMENLARGEKSAIERILLAIMNGEKDKEKDVDPSDVSSGSEVVALGMNQKLIVTVNKTLGDALVQVPQEMVLFSMYEKVAADIERQTKLISTMNVKIAELESDIERKRRLIRLLMEHEAKLVAMKISNAKRAAPPDDGAAALHSQRSGKSSSNGGGDQATTNSNSEEFLNTGSSSLISLDKSFSRFLDVARTSSPIAAKGPISDMSCSRVNLNRMYSMRKLPYKTSNGSITTGSEMNSSRMTLDRPLNLLDTSKRISVDETFLQNKSAKPTRIPTWNGRVVKSIWEMVEYASAAEAEANVNGKIEPRNMKMPGGLEGGEEESVATLDSPKPKSLVASASFTVIPSSSSADSAAAVAAAVSPLAGAKSTAATTAPTTAATTASTTSSGWDLQHQLQHLNRQLHLQLEQELQEHLQQQIEKNEQQEKEQPSQQQQDEQQSASMNAVKSKLPSSIFPSKVPMGPFQSYASNFNRFIANIKTTDSDVDKQTPINTSLVYAECNRYKPNGGKHYEPKKMQLFPSASKTTSHSPERASHSLAMSTPQSSNLLSSSSTDGAGASLVASTATTPRKSTTTTPLPSMTMTSRPERRSRVDSTGLKAEVKSMVSRKGLKDGYSVKSYNPNNKRIKK